MQKYTDFTGKTPEELIDEAEKEIDDGIRGRKRKIRRYLTDYRNQMQDSGLAEKTVHLNIAGVRSFYGVFDVDLPKLAKSDMTSNPLEKNKPIPTKDSSHNKLCTSPIVRLDFHNQGRQSKFQ